MKFNGNLLNKIKNRIWQRIVARMRNTRIYPAIYLSWWHSKLPKRNNNSVHATYLSAVPNPGAGIGHQMANWIAVYWFAQQFGLQFAHTPFTGGGWESFLGFGYGEPTTENLLCNGRYRKVRIPLFDEHNPIEVGRTKKIIAAYCGQKVVFVLEQDQFYQDQFGVINAIQDKFYRCPARQDDRLVYDPVCFNVAIHVRRGDISDDQLSGNPNLLLRWQDADYFENVLESILTELALDKPIRIYLFSQGRKEEFAAFARLGEINYCLDMGAKESFLHLVFADILITSKSSFSYKPALLSRGIKVCPKNFWHGYPDSPTWILADEDGSFDSLAVTQLASACASQCEK
jgi:hypothetical protein